MIDAAMHRVPADLVIRNCRVVDVYTGTVRPDSIAITYGRIIGFGDDYTGNEEIDAGGAYAAPGLIDAHIHIESSYLSPEEFGRMVVPRGTTTVIADPHEIVNVYGLEGFSYMIQAASRTELSVRYMVPSCVPATPLEDSGAVVNAFDMHWPMGDRHVPGMGEFMNYPGIINKDEDVLNKLLVALNMNKVIDGHSPSVFGAGLNAYIASGVKSDHECTTVREMEDRLQRGMYVQLRDGSACHLAIRAPTAGRRASRRTITGAACSVPTTASPGRSWSAGISTTISASSSAPASIRSWPSAWPP